MVNSGGSLAQYVKLSLLPDPHHPPHKIAKSSKSTFRSSLLLFEYCKLDAWSVCSLFALGRRRCVSFYYIFVAVFSPSSLFAKQLCASDQSVGPDARLGDDQRPAGVFGATAP